MNYTEHYQLSQFESNDRIQMEDFNEDNQKIEEALLSSSYVSGSYTGDGKTLMQGGKTIDLGFYPSFLIFTIGWKSYASMTPGFYVCGRDSVDAPVRMLSNGFNVGRDPQVCSVALNDSNVVYNFIAFR